MDDFLNEIEHEQYLEWVEHFSTEPADWQAVQIAVQRLSLMIARGYTDPKKQLAERDFRLELRTPLTPEQIAEQERIQWEAMAIRSEVEARHNERKRRRKSNVATTN